MPSTHTSLHYHVIFATKNREPRLGIQWQGQINGLMALPLASLRDAVVRGIRFRWYRFAQPPATGFHASGIRFRLHKIESPVTFRSHTILIPAILILNKEGEKR